MSIRYSGNVYRVTSTLEDAVRDVVAGSDIQAEPIADGSVKVAGARVDIDDGSFTVTVTDNPQVFRPYRLMITERQVDPCADERRWLRLARSQLQVARQEGLSGRVIRGFGQAVSEAEQQLSDCVSASAVARVRPLVFRSMDMYRTGDAREDDLEVYSRALTAEDWQYLRASRYELSEFIPYSSLMGEVGRHLPPEIKVDLIGRIAASEIRVDVRTIKASFSVRGHINIILAPLSGPDYRRFIGFTRSDVDLHGLIGSIAGWFVHQEELADRAVNTTAIRFNNDIATQLEPLFDMGLTLTMDGLVAEQNGIRVSATIGFLKGGHPDPCQDLRNVVIVEESEFAVALREGLSSQAIAARRNSLQRARQAVNDCRARQ